MSIRGRNAYLAISAVLVLSACSTGDGDSMAGPGPWGAIELAVAETCSEVPAAECTAVQGQDIVLPTQFERAAVEHAEAVEGQGMNSVEVTFSKDGAALFHDLTEKAAQAQDSARLLIKVGGEIRSVVTVIEPLKENSVQIDFSPDMNAQQAIDSIRAS